MIQKLNVPLIIIYRHTTVMTVGICFCNFHVIITTELHCELILRPIPRSNRGLSALLVGSRFAGIEPAQRFNHYTTPPSHLMRPWKDFKE